MSTLEKLSILGIRSFGIDKEDEQKIHFQSPLTLIVGENGCGKTTIIECLKFALTGEKPPGTDNGKTFIHDPKIFKQHECLGRVRLMINSTGGNKLTCTRAVKTSLLKGNKTKFETLDSTIDVENAAGNKIQLSKRCADTTTEMCAAMGVSKAILNNVIFCHQEDSNWPLDEGKKLKEKFDAIFGTTEYNKAIDKIIKKRKSHQDKCKLETQAKNFLETEKNETEKKQNEVEKLRVKHIGMTEDYQRYLTLLKPLQDEMEKIMEMEKHVGRLGAQIESINLNIENSKNGIEKIRNKIKRMIDGNIPELEEQLASFRETQQMNLIELKEMEKQQRELTAREKVLQEKINDAKVKLSTFFNQREQEQDLISNRFIEIKKLCAKLNIEYDADHDCDSDVKLDSIFEEIKSGIADIEEQFYKIRMKEDEKEKNFQKQIDMLREEKTAHETNLVAQQNRLSKIKNDRSTFKSDIAGIEASMPMLNDLCDQIDIAEIELKDYEKRNKVEHLEEQKIVLEVEKDEMDSQLTTLDRDIEYLQSVSKITGELEIKERELEKDSNDLERTRNKNTANLRVLFNNKEIDKNYNRSVQSCHEKLEQEIKILNKSLNDNQMTSNRLQTQRKHLKDQHKSKESELTEIKDKIDELCEGQNYNEVLSKVKEKLTKSQMDLGYLKSSEQTFKHYVKEIVKDPCCPLCHKDLDDTESDDLKTEIDDKIKKLPKNITEAEKKLKEDNKMYDKLISMKSSHDRIVKLEKEVKELKDDMDRVDKQNSEALLKIEDLEVELLEPNEKMKIFQPSFIGEMSRMDDLLRNIQLKSKEVASLKSKLSDKMPGGSLEEAQQKRRKLNVDSKLKGDQVKELNQKINKIQSDLMTAREKLGKMRSQKIEYQEKVQGLDRLKTQLKDVEKEKMELEKKLQDEQDELGPLKKKLSDTMRDKESAKEVGCQKIKRHQENINDLKKINSEIERLSSEVDKLSSLNLVVKIEECQKNSKSWESSQKSLATEHEKMSREISRLNSEISNQEINERNLMDNLELQNMQKSLQENVEQQKALRKKFGDLNVKKLQKDKIENDENQKQIQAKRNTIYGQLAELENRISEADKDLSSNKHKNSKLNYQKAVFKIAVLKRIIDDLGKYRLALEWALMKFHTEKMEQINRIIRELWNSIYRGNDIDYIMIKTDEDTLKNSADKKRSFNYRVVQVKNGGVEVDMRGRCSAGQKVLASLIIRMALADTFSANCGVLALDEPTTNLDHKNIRALCAALCKICDERGTANKNFMMIIITHDEEFVTALDKSEYYFKLSRSDNGKSKIEKISTH
ncbi:unnamed protein product [Diamesa hyperborea]